MTGCDAGRNATLTFDPVTGEVTGCRCLVCARCGHHTGNNNQGHFWSWCKVTRSTGNFHFCCPGDCELEARNGTVDVGDQP